MKPLLASLALTLSLPFSQLKAEYLDYFHGPIIEERNLYTKVVNPKEEADSLSIGINSLLLYPKTKKGDNSYERRGIFETFSLALCDELSSPPAEVNYQSRDMGHERFPLEEKFFDAFLNTAKKKMPFIRKIEKGVTKFQDTVKLDYKSKDEITYSVEPVIDSIDDFGLKFSIEDFLGIDEIYLETKLAEQNFGIEKKLKKGEFRFGATIDFEGSTSKIGFSYGIRF